MKRHLAVLAAAAAMMTAPAMYAQSTSTTPVNPARPGVMMPNGMRGHGGRMKQLGLSAQQKAQIKAIHARYAPQLKGARNAARPDIAAARAARARGDSATYRADMAKVRSELAPTRSVRQQEMAEIRAVLTPAQRQQLAIMRANRKGVKHRGATGATRA